MKKIWFFLLLAFASVNLIAQTSHIISVSNNVFTPLNVNISVGDTIVWQWVQGTHTTTSDTTAGPDAWDAPIDNGHQVFRKVITTPGIHHYYCIFHQAFGMVGTITASNPSGVNDENISASGFKLEQNYPNPFNPSTVISYSINKPGFVSLKIYNSVGQEVESLINGDQSSGVHSIVFDAGNINGSSLASGVYFYRLKTQGYVQTRKMLLLK